MALLKGLIKSLPLSYYISASRFRDVSQNFVFAQYPHVQFLAKYSDHVLSPNMVCKYFRTMIVLLSLESTEHNYCSGPVGTKAINSMNPLQVDKIYTAKVLPRRLY